MQTKNLLRLVLVAIWSVLVFGCFFLVIPGIGKDPSLPSVGTMQWPASSEIPRYSDSGHLVVFVHPYCPCTRATLKNLDELEASDQLTITIVQLRTERLQTYHSPISSIASLVEKNGWNHFMDTEGSEAKRFNALTSGECWLFDSDGVLRFVGGITASRGHAGGNQGLETLKTLILQMNNEAADVPNLVDRMQKLNHPLAQHPTFGCPLFSDSRCNGISL